MGRLWLMIAILTLAGCSQEERNDSRINNQKEKIVALESKIQELEKQKEILISDVTDIKVEKGVAKYIITLEIKQSNPLNLEKSIRNSMNAIELQIPVDKEYYDSLEVDDMLDDTFRFGSFLMEGSFGSWKIKVIDKEIK